MMCQICNLPATERRGIEMAISKGLTTRAIAEKFHIVEDIDRGRSVVNLHRRHLNV